MVQHTEVVALGITSDGHEHILGLWEGTTEDAALYRSLLADLVERGLEAEEGLLVVINCSKALATAVKDAFDQGFYPALPDTQEVAERRTAISLDGSLLSRSRKRLPPD